MSEGDRRPLSRTTVVVGRVRRTRAVGGMGVAPGVA